MDWEDGSPGSGTYKGKILRNPKNFQSALKLYFPILIVHIAPVLPSSRNIPFGPLVATRRDGMVFVVRNERHIGVLKARTVASQVKLVVGMAGYLFL